MALPHSNAHDECDSERDIVARPAGPAACERLEPRQIVAHLEAQPSLADGRIGARGAVGFEDRLRCDIEVAVVMRAPAQANADERRELPQVARALRPARAPRQEPSFDTGIVLDDVEHLITRSDAIHGLRPAERPAYCEPPRGAPRCLCAEAKTVHQQVALTANGHVDADEWSERELATG